HNDGRDVPLTVQINAPLRACARSTRSTRIGSGWHRRFGLDHVVLATKLHAYQGKLGFLALRFNGDDALILLHADLQFGSPAVALVVACQFMRFLRGIIVMNRDMSTGLPGAFAVQHLAIFLELGGVEAIAFLWGVLE